jgi:hypothetical protein
VWKEETYSAGAKFSTVIRLLTASSTRLYRKVDHQSEREKERETVLYIAGGKSFLKWKLLQIKCEMGT